MRHLFILIGYEILYMIDNKREKNLSVDVSSDNNLHFYVRKMNYQGTLMINICDKELLGINIVSDSLNINITNDFLTSRQMRKR